MTAAVVDFPCGVKPSGMAHGVENVRTISGKTGSRNGSNPFINSYGLYSKDEVETESHPLKEVQRNDRTRDIIAIAKHLEPLQKHFQSVDENVFERALVFMSVFCVLSQSKNISIENTKNESILFRSEARGHSVYLEFFFDEEEPNGYDIVLNLYKDKKHVASYAGDMDLIFIKYFEKTGQVKAS